MMSAEMNQVNIQETRVAEAEFKSTCALFTSGVTVVTRIMPDGEPYGLTVSAFAPVSLQPPLVLVCIENRVAFLHGLELREAFAVNILEENQQEISVRFADPRIDRFAQTHWQPGWRGVPILPDGLAIFQCQLHQMVSSGDHQVLIGEVRIVARRQGRPLVYHNRGYRKLEAS